MKKLIILLLVCTSFANCSSLQPTIVSAETFKKEKIVDLPNQTKNNIFVKANDWTVSAFTNAESVIQFSDKKEGTIIGKYLLFGNVHYSAYTGTIDNRIYAKITIQVKDNKARIITIPTGDITIYKETALATLHNSLENLINDFENTMLTTETTEW